VKANLFLGVAAAAALSALSAHATTKDFTYSYLGSTVATGSFSYATGDTGVLTYSDLTAFSVTVAGVTYDLADVDALTDYVYFGYDTSSNDFVTSGDLCGYGGCGLVFSLSASNDGGTDGFEFNNVPGYYVEYSTGNFGMIDTITITGVPEPASWALMLVGLGGLGAALRSRRKLAAAAA
jgi:hypothetical protein